MPIAIGSEGGIGAINGAVSAANVEAITMAGRGIYAQIECVVDVVHAFGHHGSAAKFVARLALRPGLNRKFGIGPVAFGKVDALYLAREVIHVR